MVNSRRSLMDQTRHRKIGIIKAYRKVGTNSERDASGVRSLELGRDTVPIVMNKFLRVS